MTVSAVVEQTLEQTGLIYSSDSQPGIKRLKKGKGFSYQMPNGEPVKDEKTIDRIHKLVLPPAYKSVWICKSPRGYIQATGIDARGRKQYRYHADWSASRETEKFEHMEEFGKALPKIREAVDADLRKQGMPREKVLAIVVRLLEETLIRVGNEKYAKENDSYGLTTLKTRHVDVYGSKTRFKFKGKSGVEHKVTLKDRRLGSLMKKLQELPGQDLFTYLDDNGETHSVSSGDVNAYLREISGKGFTAKDFRTWAGTLLAFTELADCEACDSESGRKKAIVAAVKKVAQRLGNTPAVCRKSYVHSALLESASVKLPLRMGRSGDLPKELISFLRGAARKPVKAK